MTRQDNYYFKKFSLLLDEGLSTKEAWEETCSTYLDDKPERVQERKLSKTQRNNLFWNSDIWDNVPAEIYKTDSFIFALTKNLRISKLDNIDLVVAAAKIAPKSFEEAVRASKIFLGQNANYLKLKNQLVQGCDFKEFFMACEVLSERYLNYRYEVDKIQTKLQSFDYLDLLCVMSLYLMEQAEKHQSDIDLIESNGTVLSEILQDRLSENDKRKSAINKKYIKDKFSKYFFSAEPPIELEILEEIIYHYTELHRFEHSVLSTFCYDNNFNYKVHQKYLQLKPINVVHLIQWHRNGEKSQYAHHLYGYLAMKKAEHEYEGEIFGLEENHEINKEAHILAESIELQVREVYGLGNDVQLGVGKSIPLEYTVKSLSYALAFYRHLFSNEYFGFLNQSENWWEAWKKLVLNNILLFNTDLLQSNNDRLPLLMSNVGFFADTIKKQFPLPVTDAKEIEHFWTYDLNLAGKTGHKVPNIFEKPFFKMDGFIFRLPWMLAFQNPTTTFVNNLRRVHDQRKDELKKEVHVTESFIADLFVKSGFIATAGYKPPNYTQYEIDVLAFRDGHLFILEFKSTYQRTNLDEAWLHKSNNIRKASQQLIKRRHIIEKLIRNSDSSFIGQFGKPDQIHTWIIDTSFEYDHEYFRNSLKISLFELLHALNGDNKGFYPNEFNANQFIRVIESQSLWKELMPDTIISEEKFVYNISL